MKRIIKATALTALLALWTLTVFAAVPQLINFQGILKDGSGNPVANGSYSVVFTIYDAPTGGTNLWTETQSVTTTSGLFNTLLGSATPIADTLFNDSSRYLGIKVGADPEMTPRQKMSSVGFSYVSGQWNSSDSNLYRMNGNVGIGIYPGAKLDVNNAASSASPLLGVEGIADNSSSGPAEGGYFAAGPSGTGPKEGVVGLALGSASTASRVYGTYGLATNSSFFGAIGAYGEGENSSSGTAYGGYFTTSSDGTGGHIGAYGEANAATNYSIGVSGNGYNNNSTAYGIKGYATSSSADAFGGYFQGSGVTQSTGAYGSGSSFGVHGYSCCGGGIGVYGESDYIGIDGNGIGASPGYIYGCYGYASNTYGGGFFAPSYGGYFEAHSTTGHDIGVYASGSEYAGYFVGNTIVTGSKSAAVKTDNGDYHLMYAEEATENWFEDFGTAQMVNGKARVNIDPVYAQTVNTSVAYHVFLTPEGDCRGLYVASKNANSFEIRELQNGKSDLSVSYRIVAKRKGYENVRLAKLSGPTPEEIQAEGAKRRVEQAKLSARDAEMRKQVEAERVKMEQERVIPEQKIKENK